MFYAPVRDLAAVGFCLLAAVLLPARIRARLCRAFAGLANRHWTASVAGAGIAVVVIRLCCLPVLPRPAPLIPDEYSYLFLARTLLTGRFSNPAHPLWPHFETLFILQRPTYASVYPPLQGAVLAFGYLIVRDPWAGVLASMAGMCAAVVWMLRACVTRAWALYGGLLAAAGYGLLSYWTNSYWGGYAAAAGGALIFGALPRMTASVRRRDAAIFGLGLIALATSRPYEGFLAALPAVFLVAHHFFNRPEALRRQGPLLAGVLAAGAILICWYNWRVTGSPLRLPHSTYIRQYAAAPAFIWQKPLAPPQYRERVLRDAHLSFGIEYAGYGCAADAAEKSAAKLVRLAVFYWGPLWVLPLLALPEFLRQRRYRAAALSTAICLAGILLTVGFQVHYAAPCTAVFVLMLVDASRRLSRALPGMGTALVIALPAAWLGSQVAMLPAAPVNRAEVRRSVQAAVDREPGRHVVLVHYGRSHRLGDEWVYNEPDIDRSPVIWARDLGAHANEELMRYYPGRTFWLAYADEQPPRVVACASVCSAPKEKPPSPVETLSKGTRAILAH